VTYRDHQIFTVPPPSQGIALLEALNILEGYNLSQYSIDNPETVHLLVEAMKLGFADREYPVNSFKNVTEV
jgi:gamma-glutamyltranspeptidase / glutathione hydrolase